MSKLGRHHELLGDENGDANVRTITEVDIANDLISILGESYPAKAATRDMQLVSSILKKLTLTGNVSKNVMG